MATSLPNGNGAAAKGSVSSGAVAVVTAVAVGVVSTVSNGFQEGVGLEFCKKNYYPLPRKLKKFNSLSPLNFWTLWRWHDNTFF